MATCNESITAALAAGIGTIPVIYPNTITPWAATGTENSLFTLGSAGVQSSSFNFTVSSSTPGITVTLFRLNEDESFTLMGSVTINMVTANFNFDVGIGTHILCIRRSGFVNQSGTFVANFTSFPISATLPSRAYHGHYCTSEIFSVRPPVICNAPVYFEITEGGLPPGLILTDLGIITGKLPVLDCTENNPSPSIGWWNDVEGSNHPFGREWRFKLKIFTTGMKDDLKQEAWFCVRIHNNWDLDRDLFMSQMPFDRVTTVRVVEEPNLLPKSLCTPCVGTTANPERFKPKPLLSSECPACEEPNQDVRVDLIEIPLDMCECPPDDILLWYKENVGRTFDSPYVQAFMDRLENSQAFRILLVKSGVGIDNNPDQFAIVNTYDNFLQITIVEPESEDRDPESYSALIDQWRQIQNQNFPLTTVARHGHYAESDLTKHTM